MRVSPADFRHVDWFGCRNQLFVLAGKAVSQSRDFKILGYTVGQAPNLPLVVVILAALVARIAEEGSGTDRIAASVFVVSLSIWSYLEAVDGVNVFRRLLGMAGFVVVLTRLVGQLH